MNLKFWSKNKPKQNVPTRDTSHVRADKQSWMAFKSKQKRQEQPPRRISEILKKNQKPDLPKRGVGLWARLKNLPKLGAPSLPGFPENIPSFSLWILFPIVLLVVGFGFGYFLYEQQVFVIKEVLIEGNSEISDLQIIGVIGDLHGQSMIQIPGADLEAKLLEAFPYIKNVYVSKELPGKLEILVEERFPELAYANLSGAFLVDEDNVVIEVLGVSEQPELFEHERLVIDGYGDPEADYVFTEYISDIEDDQELRELDWDEVPEDDKKVALNKLRRKLRQRINGIHDEESVFIRNAGFDNLVVAFGYDAQVYEIGDNFPPEVVTYSTRIKYYFEDEGINLRKILWKSTFTIQAEILASTDVLFTSSKEIEDQLQTFQVLRESRVIRTANLIDLRSEIVAVE